jgi:signal transduction histidine kinase
VRLRSLKALTAAFLLIFLGVTVATGLMVNAASRSTIAQLVDRRIATESSNVIGPSPVDPVRVAARIEEFSHQRDTGDIGFELRDGSGWHIAGNVKLDRHPPMGFTTIGESVRIKGLSHGRALVRDIGGGMTLTTIAETEPFDHYSAERVRIYLIGFGSIIVVVVAATLLFGRIVSHRIAALRATANAIIDGDLQRRVPTDGSDSEFDRQARTFNRMLDRIGDLMAEIGNLSNEIAHDLRTPLARLRAQLLRLSRRTGDDALRDEVDRVIAQSDEILAMFAAIMRIAEIEGGARRAGFAPLDLTGLVEEVCATMAPIAEDEGHSLIVAATDSVRLVADRQLLSQALINLIENGIRHTPAGSAIRVSVVAGTRFVVMRVADDGPGIAPDQHGQALRRFGRTDASRSRPGHGLGLPLVAAIARLHGGSVELADADPGLAVSVLLSRTDGMPGTEKG